MRRIRWSEAAADDLDAINGYLRQHHPSYRQPTVRRLYVAARALTKYPHRGRPGRKEGTREMFVLPLPYLIVYAVQTDFVHILRIIHTSQDDA